MSRYFQYSCGPGAELYHYGIRGMKWGKHMAEAAAAGDDITAEELLGTGWQESKTGQGQFTKSYTTIWGDTVDKTVYTDINDAQHKEQRKKAAQAFEQSDKYAKLAKKSMSDVMNETDSGKAAKAIAKTLGYSVASLANRLKGGYNAANGTAYRITTYKSVNGGERKKTNRVISPKLQNDLTPKIFRHYDLPGYSFSGIYSGRYYNAPHDYLAHHGVKGMKWGKHIFGALKKLDSGMRKVGSVGAKASKGAVKAVGAGVKTTVKTAGNVKRSVDNAKKASEEKKRAAEPTERDLALQAVQSGSAKDVIKYRSSLTTAELKAAQDRINTVQKIADMQANDIGAGLRAVDSFNKKFKVVADVAGNVGRVADSVTKSYNAYTTVTGKKPGQNKSQGNQNKNNNGQNKPDNGNNSNNGKKPSNKTKSWSVETPNKLQSDGSTVPSMREVVGSTANAARDVGGAVTAVGNLAKTYGGLKAKDAVSSARSKYNDVKDTIDLFRNNSSDVWKDLYD